MVQDLGLRDITPNNGEPIGQVDGTLSMDTWVMSGFNKIWGFLKLGVPLQVFLNKDYNSLGIILGSP